MRSWVRDARYGLRTLVKTPGFAVVVVLTMAIGIGVNTAMFSIVDATLLRPLPYREPERLVFVRDIQPQLKDLPGSYHEFLDWKEQEQILSGTSAYQTGALTLITEAGPERVSSVDTTPSLFGLLDLRPAVGRVLVEADDDPGGEPVVLLSHGLWQRRFGGDRAVVGSRIDVEGVPTTVVGVLEPGLESRLPTELRRGESRDLWRPLRLTRETTVRGSHFLAVVARLQPGVTIEQADAEIARVARAFKDDGRTKHGIMLVPVVERIVGGTRTQVLVLMGAVAFVLLIACVNIANLLLARAASRGKEVAIRSSLGAGRWRLVQQFLTESLVLAAAGGLLGLGLAWWCVRLFSASPAAALLRTGSVALSPTVLAFCAGLTLLAGALAGFAPALQASVPNLDETLREDGRRAGTSAGRRGFRNALVIVEVGLSLVLLVGAGLMLRSFRNLLDVDLGFDPSGVLTFYVALPDTKYEDEEAVRQFYDRALEEIGALPGVEGTGIVNTLPLEGGWNGTFEVDGVDWPEGFSPLAETRQVNPGYFAAMRIPLMRGRGFEETDTADSHNVAVVNQEFVRQVFGDDDPLGRTLYWGDEPDSPRTEIVGVVGDVQHWSVGRERRPAIYFPFHQLTRSSMVFVARTTGDPLRSVAGVKARVAGIDADQPISGIRTMERVLAQDLAERRVSMQLLLGFALLAAFLASIGLYGVMNYLVALRTHEMGIRMAMGAGTRSILGLVMRQGLLLTGCGLLLGVLGALPLTRFLSSLVYDVSTTDPLTFAGVPVLLLVVGLVACWVPARRAARVDPIVAMR